jgi:stage II sporulation protein AA (anti-sigma F factor antagonist)
VSSAGQERHRDSVLGDGFLVHVVRHDAELIVAVGGDLDLYTSSMLEQQISIDDDHLRAVVIDLRDVSFMDSIALRTLWNIQQRVVAAGGRLLLKSPSVAVTRVLDITGLTSSFTIVDLGPPGERIARRA